MADEYTLKEVLSMGDDEIIDLAYNEWLDSDDCSRWSMENIYTNEADQKLGWWFDGWLCDLPDPLEEYAKGFSTTEIERIERLMVDFAQAATDSIEAQEDYYQTLMGLPR